MTDRTLTVKTVKTVDVNDIGYELWCGALDRWEDADDDTREAVFDRICDWTADEEEVDMTTVNDIIWFECDDLFYPDDEDGDEEEDEDDEDEDEDEDEEDEKTEGEMKAVNTILIGRIGGEFKQLQDGSVENTIVHSTLNSGEETVTFVTVRFRGKQAKLVCTHLSKGDLCCIEGRRGEKNDRHGSRETVHRSRTHHISLNKETEQCLELSTNLHSRTRTARHQATISSTTRQDGTSHGKNG